MKKNVWFVIVFLFVFSGCASVPKTVGFFPRGFANDTDSASVVKERYEERFGVKVIEVGTKTDSLIIRNDLGRVLHKDKLYAIHFETESECYVQLGTLRSVHIDAGVFTNPTLALKEKDNFYRMSSLVGRKFSPANTKYGWSFFRRPCSKNADPPKK